MVKPEQDVKTSTQISAAGWCFIRRQKQLSTAGFQYWAGRNGCQADVVDLPPKDRLVKFVFW